jgi:hypothetical protein
MRQSDSAMQVNKEDHVIVICERSKGPWFLLTGKNVLNTGKNHGSSLHSG